MQSGFWRFSLFLLAGAIVAGCAPADETAEAEAPAATAETPSADEAAVEQIRADYVTHYNMQHADVVADLYADSAIALLADGAVLMGKAAVLADLQADVAGSPTLELTTGDIMVLGENAAAHGTWRVSTTMEGAAEPVQVGGHYLTFFTKSTGEWKIGNVITNFDSPAPEGMPLSQYEGETPPDDGTMKAVMDAYAQAFNAGDAAAIAALYTADGFHAYSNSPVTQGPAAIQQRLTERFAAGPRTMEIHDVGTYDLGDGWALDAGWYRLTTPGEGGASTIQEGTYMNLMQQQPDGSWKIHWGVSNGNPRS